MFMMKSIFFLNKAIIIYLPELLIIEYRRIYYRGRVNLEEHVFYPFGQTTTVPIDDDSTTINDSTFELIKLTVSRQTCIVVFAVLTLSVIVSAFVQSALLMSVCTTASMNLHNCMFGSITRATMHFLNTNPTGDSIYIILLVVLIINV